MLRSERIIKQMVMAYVNGDIGTIFDSKWDAKQGTFERLILNENRDFVFGVEPSVSKDYTAFSRLPESAFTEFHRPDPLSNGDAIKKVIVNCYASWEKRCERIDQLNSPRLDARTVMLAGLPNATFLPKQEIGKVWVTGRNTGSKTIFSVSKSKDSLVDTEYEFTPLFKLTTKERTAQLIQFIRDLENVRG